MSKLMGFGVCCGFISFWGIVQLGVMGLCYKLETPILIEDVHAHNGEYNSYQEFVEMTRENYRKTSLNCWMAAGGYVGSFVISYICILIAKGTARSKEKKQNDDDYLCTPKSKIPGQEFVPEKVPTESVPVFSNYNLNDEKGGSSPMSSFSKETAKPVSTKDISRI